MTDSFDTLGNQQTVPGEPEGRLLANRYKIVRKLGEGGMGMVYLAEDTELGTFVAIKFIPPPLAGNARAIKSLKREARTAMRLSHPNIVRLHDLHTDGHSKFLIMEYTEGKTLDDLLAEKEGDKLTLEELFPLAEQIAAGLDYAHSRGVLHRDLKPSNIMVASDGSVKLLDFGIAREVQDSFTLVTGQETSGTLPYMSLEQLMGEKPTPSMDIYSLAAVLYECLSGRPPFCRGDIRRQIETKQPDELADVPAHANSALKKALDKNPKGRPQKAGQLIQLLRGKPTRKTKVKPPPTTRPQKARKRTRRMYSLVSVLTGHRGGVTSISISPNGEYVASGSRDKNVKIWNTSTGECLHTLEGHSYPVCSVAFSPDGCCIVSGAKAEGRKRPGEIMIWAKEKGRCLRKIRKGLLRIGPPDDMAGVAYSFDGTSIASAGGYVISIWDAKTGAHLRSWRPSKPVLSIAYSPKNLDLLSGGWDWTITLWDTTGQGVQKWEELVESEGGISCVAFSSDGSQCVSVDSACMKVWDLTTFDSVLTIDTADYRGANAAAFSPDSRFIVCGDRERCVSIWDAATGKCRQEWKAHSHAVMSVRFSPDGRHVISAGTDKKVKIWAVELLD